MQREPRRPAAPTSHLTPRGHQTLRWGSHFLHRRPRRDSQFLKAITSALPVSGLPTPRRHRTDTEKSEADQAEGCGFGDGAGIGLSKRVGYEEAKPDRLSDERAVRPVRR